MARPSHVRDLELPRDTAQRDDLQNAAVAGSVLPVAIGEADEGRRPRREGLGRVAARNPRHCVDRASLKADDPGQPGGSIVGTTVQQGAI